MTEVEDNLKISHTSPLAPLSSQKAHRMALRIETKMAKSDPLV